ncbi:hypothetical protein VSDG_06845 [Cytospora chrysosperma]|uniref:Uncharacterized protein n=1 Tax=Cytospora chrysosperma TaxID=252740 RepID=A0A423VQI1_CYTCH|nr:hypothetical protein VSDG_06845 [Valsa sordida]
MKKKKRKRAGDAAFLVDQEVLSGRIITLTLVTLGCCRGVQCRKSYKGIEQVSPDDFRRLVIEPDGEDPAELARWRVEHRKTVTKLWLDAQIMFYGLPLLPETREYRLKVVRNWMKMGTICLEGMTAFWDNQFDAYNKCLESHPKRQEFDQLTTLEEKLALGPDLLMDTYFLDRNTTPEALSFTSFDWEKVKPAADKVETLYARVVGTGKKKVLRIGWKLHEVMHPIHQDLADNAVRREIGKLSARVARMQPHHDYMERRKNKTSEDGPSIVGSYHMEITGTGWKDELYRPDNMWMDIRESWMTEGVYEAMFDFGPALKGMMLISTDKGRANEEEDDSRVAFLQGFLYAIKRLKKSDEHEAAFAAHKYTALLRGSHRVPEWAGDMSDTYTSETNGVLTFKDGELCGFSLSRLCERFSDVPALSPLEGKVRGLKVSERPQHEMVVPQPERPVDVIERMLDMTRDDLDPSRKRKRADWGSLREYTMDMNFYMLHSVVGGL